MQKNDVMPAWAGALAGVVAGAVALGVAQLVAGVLKPAAFPVVAVGNVVVDNTPAWLKEFAISNFGSNDKTVLIAGVLVVLAVVAAVIGVLARHRVAYGLVGLGVFGVVGIAAVVTRPGAGALDVVPTVVGVGVGAWGLTWLLARGVRESYEGAGAAVPGSSASGASGASGVRAAARSASGATAASGVKAPASSASDVESGSGGSPTDFSGAPGDEAERPAVMRTGAEPYSFDRRRLLGGVAGGVVVAGAATLAGRVLGGRQTAETARVAVALPRPRVAAKPLPQGTDFGIRGLSPFVTKNQDFYRVDTALIVPHVDPRQWTLRIHGMVDRPVEITYADLLKRPLTESYVTLTCVSNEVGGEYIGNARWLGARMADVLRDAGLQSGADMLLSTSDDGFTAGTPVDVVMDGRDALFAIAMNGEALPVEHGFPVRQVVPGLYGYVSATKWVVDVKVTRFDRDEAYWTPRGWSAKGPIKTESRIDLPKPGASVTAGRTTIAGVAWAQHTGIDAVEVRVDRSEWRQAKLAQVPGPDTWRQWSLDWDLTAGKHTIEVRATDAAGRTQTEQQAPPAPDGASGWHSIQVNVA
ncbi:molybdopterin-dependent oxidoreductase [Nonomuraea sp. NPDC048901]|uniref:molybdopterin-dependent oxidoreductase n=1 Tax=Nonomuraea sp. NPDC048901 TaxID=3155627 RepID=UPI003408C843